MMADHLKDLEEMVDPETNLPYTEAQIRDQRLAICNVKKEKPQPHLTLRSPFKIQLKLEVEMSGLINQLALAGEVMSIDTKVSK